uniref:Staufen double-stranded RNA binding protein 2 n=1 Tax=Microcebus murinus TaxID=30608 RepID=A0A8C5W2H5_MICMU
MFSVQLSLGEQTWESEGSSIKKAQQAVANKALTESALPKPVQKPAKSNVNNNPGSITPTVELNGLAMKRGEPAIYRPLDPKPFPNYRANYNFRGMYNQRFVYDNTLNVLLGIWSQRCETFFSLSESIL